MAHVVVCHKKCRCPYVFWATILFSVADDLLGRQKFLSPCSPYGPHFLYSFVALNCSTTTLYFFRSTLFLICGPLTYFLSLARRMEAPCIWGLCFTTTVSNITPTFAYQYITYFGIHKHKYIMWKASIDIYILCLQC